MTSFYTQSTLAEEKIVLKPFMFAYFIWDQSRQSTRLFESDL